MIAFEKIVSSERATDLLKKVKELDDAYFIDRSKYIPNPCLDGTPNKYLSMSDDAMPKEIYDELYSWFEGQEVEQILVNRYYPGMHLGPHIDSNMYEYVTVVFLDSELDVLNLESPDGWVTVTDEPGKAVTITRDVVHSVSPVPVMRHSIIVIRDQL